MSWKPELDDLARREAFAHAMGGDDKVRRQHDAGRLTVRERIARHYGEHYGVEVPAARVAITTGGWPRAARRLGTLGSGARTARPVTVRGLTPR